jgi:hypothetical protein
VVDVSQALKGAANQGAPEIPPNEFVRRLMDEHPSEVLPFPRNGANGKPLFDYRMCVLSQRDLDGCLVDAERYAANQFKQGKKPTDEALGAVRGEAWTEVYNNAKIVEVLLKACRQCEAKTSAAGKRYYEPLFVGGEQIRSLLTPDEMASLFNAYRNVQFKFGPLFRMLDADQVDAIVNQLEEGWNAYPLQHLESGQLILIVASLAERLRSMRTDIGSSSGQQEPGTDDTSQIQSE